MSIKVAVDDGYGNMKVVFKKNGKLEKHIIPSHITTRSVFEMGSSLSHIRSMRSEGGIIYFVGAKNESEDTRFGDFATHDINRILVRYALSRSGIADDADFDLAVGLPVHQYYSGGNMNKGVITEKREHHKKPVFLVGEHDANMPLSTPGSVRCYPQSLMVPLNYSEEGLDMATSTMVVVDIGYRTTDITYLDDANLNSNKCGGIPDLGIAYAIDEFGKSIIRRFGYQMSAAIVNKFFERGHVMHNGERFDVSAERDAALESMADAIFRSTERIIGSSASIDRIVLIGGGAGYLLDFLRKQDRWPQAVLHPDPMFANALAWLNEWEKPK